MSIHSPQQRKMEITSDYKKLIVNPIFEPIKKLFEFYILGIGFVGQFDFQEIFLKHNPDLKEFVDRYNDEVNLRIEGQSVKSETKTYWTSLGRIMAIALFDILQFSKFNNDLNTTEIYKFAKHIRNGAAHNNMFHFDEPLDSPIQWQDKIINNDLNGTPVFPEFIAPTSLIFLMADISVLMIRK